jgi:glycosyltransferase involved in cell wall biosynthesis
VRIMVLGLRGVPNVQGGVETHAEHLYGHLAAAGCRIDLIVRTQWVPARLKEFRGIRLRRLWAPSRAGLEALVHSVIGVCYAGLSRPDILHIHAVGPAIVAPLARAFGLRVVVTHHGPDYDRDKWGTWARALLRTGERWGMQASHARIVISRVIAELVRSRYGLDSDLIPNGVSAPALGGARDQIEALGLSQGRYFLQVSRLVPEKKQLDLIAAFLRAPATGWKLALVGGLDGTDYSERVRNAAAVHPDIVLAGFLSGERLRQMYAHAGAFVLPSSHEGLPIAMLEALSFGLPVIASDIPANLEVGLAAECYFPLGNLDVLTQRLADLAASEPSAALADARRSAVLERYDWQLIADQTREVYERVISAHA